MAGEARATGNKSVSFAYVLLFLLGVWGIPIHLFYLGRDFHCFASSITFGFFGLGTLRDFFRIPEYVKDYNNDPEFSAIEEIRRKHRPRPRWKTSLIIAQIILGLFVPRVLRFYIEAYFDPYLVEAVDSVGVAIGVYIIANTGRRRSSFLPLAVTALVARMVVGPLARHYVLTACILVSHYNSRHGDRLQGQERLPLMLRALRLLIGYLVVVPALYLSLSDVLGTIDTSTFSQSGAFRNWTECSEHDNSTFCQMQQLFREIYALISRPQEAAVMLNVSLDATEAEIKSKYRSLLKEYHPDRVSAGEFKTSEERAQQIQAANQKTAALHEAYEILTMHAAKRTGSE